jgi:hypothetical protein
MRSCTDRTYYLHTLDGKPAGYSGEQIVFAMKFGRPVPLCGSLREIRMQQRLSEQWRMKRGYRAEPYVYGYKRVRLP